MKPTDLVTKADNEADSKSKVDSKRRTFLLAAGCAPAIGVAVAMSGDTVAEPAAGAVEAPPEPTVSGYHVTDHIRTYYRIAGRF